MIVTATIIQNNLEQQHSTATDKQLSTNWVLTLSVLQAAEGSLTHRPQLLYVVVGRIIHYMEIEEWWKMGGGVSGRNYMGWVEPQRPLFYTVDGIYFNYMTTYALSYPVNSFWLVTLVLYEPVNILVEPPSSHYDYQQNLILTPKQHCICRCKLKNKCKHEV